MKTPDLSGRDPAGLATEEPRFRGGRLAIGAGAFLLLTGSVFWYQFSRVGIGAAGPGWDDLRWGHLGLLLLCSSVETVSCGVRIWAMTRILSPGVKLWTCLKAEWANVAISTITPTQSGGGPGQIYILSRGGATVGTAVTIMLLSCLGTTLGLFGLCLYSLLVVGLNESWPMLLTVVWTFVGIGGAMAVVAIWPALFRAALATISRAVWRLGGRRRVLYGWWPPGEPRNRLPVDRMGRMTATLVDIIYTYRSDVTRFFRAGKATCAWVCLLSLTFLVSRAATAYWCVRFLGIEADFTQIFRAQILIILVEFFAPTPGGAGVVETVSLGVMANIVPAGHAPYFNLLWRFSTLYLPALMGFIALGYAMLREAPGIMRPAWNRGPATKAAGHSLEAACRR